ncbi:hypothetical protein D6D01_07880 [Aureobasidium pullulans]|uniref:Uncharacterized protein n=1 Tax=Aureobasidium pullulans TaxID=5580 RepID=A0A4S9KIV2_AURPU|nr:hypothetical protein D6D01_07880 [Aureobasidium pullulans]
MSSVVELVDRQEVNGASPTSNPGLDDVDGLGVDVETRTGYYLVYADLSHLLLRRDCTARNTMSWTQEERQEIEEAAAILLRMADPLWTRPTSDDNDNDRVEAEENVKKGEDEDEKERDEGEKEVENQGDEDDEQVSIPCAQPATSASVGALAALSTRHSTTQQSRAAMTPAQRFRLGYNTYSDLDISGTSTGIMYMTPAERRTYRQSQRRRGAALVRAATTKGSKSKRGGAGGRRDPRGGAGGRKGPRGGAGGAAGLLSSN